MSMSNQYFEAIADYGGFEGDTNYISVMKGDVVRLIKKDKEWFTVEKDGDIGKVPKGILIQKKKKISQDQMKIPIQTPQQNSNKINSIKTQYNRQMKQPQNQQNQNHSIPSNNNNSQFNSFLSINNQQSKIISLHSNDQIKQQTENQEYSNINTKFSSDSQSTKHETKKKGSNINDSQEPDAKQTNFTPQEFQEGNQSNRRKKQDNNQKQKINDQKQMNKVEKRKEQEQEQERYKQKEERQKKKEEQMLYKNSYAYKEKKLLKELLGFGIQDQQSEQIERGQEEDDEQQQYQDDDCRMKDKQEENDEDDEEEETIDDQDKQYQHYIQKMNDLNYLDIECPFCDFNMKNEQLQEHISSQHSQQQYNIYEQTLLIQKSIMHIQYEHSDIHGIKIRCPYCSQQYPVESIDEHISQLHNEYQAQYNKLTQLLNSVLIKEQQIKQEIRQNSPLNIHPQIQSTQQNGLMSKVKSFFGSLFSSVTKINNNKQQQNALTGMEQTYQNSELIQKHLQNELQPSFPPQQDISKTNIEQIEEEGGCKEVESQLINKGNERYNIKNGALDAKTWILNCYIHRSSPRPFWY